MTRRMEFFVVCGELEVCGVRSGFDLVLCGGYEWGVDCVSGDGDLCCCLYFEGWEYGLVPWVMFRMLWYITY